MKLKELAPYCSTINVIIEYKDKKKYIGAFAYNNLYHSKKVDSSVLNEMNVISITSEVLKGSSFPISIVVVKVKGD